MDVDVMHEGFKERLRESITAVEKTAELLRGRGYKVEVQGLRLRHSIAIEQIFPMTATS